MSPWYLTLYLTAVVGPDKFIPPFPVSGVCFNVLLKTFTVYKQQNKKLIRRWDSERELSASCARQTSLDWIGLDLRGKTTVFGRHEIRLRVRASSLTVRFGSLSYDDIVHAVQKKTIDSCINSATDRRGHLAHLYRRPNPYINPSLVLGGVCRSATAALLMYVSLRAHTMLFCLQ